MNRQHTPEEMLADWAGILGETASITGHSPGRDIWRVTAENGDEYFLKRYGPWRNLPLADEARILRHLNGQGVRAAEILPTDNALLSAGNQDELFVLFPQLASRDFDAASTLAMEPGIGDAVAKLHLALSNYPWAVRSYSENLAGSLAGELLLPPDIRGLFEVRRDQMISTLENLPSQLIHGDMTPGNILLRHPGEVSGFIDFDHLPCGPRIWDMGKYLSRRIRQDWRRDDRSANHGRLDHIPEFLRGFQAMNPLEPVEIVALPAAIAAGNILETSYFMEISAGTLIRRKLPDHDEVLADTIEATHWHLTHWDAVVDAVRT